MKQAFVSKSTDADMQAVAMRVRQGGHHVPEDTIRRRFAAGLKNFQQVYRDRVDEWQWIDNSGMTPRFLADGGQT